MAGLWVQLLVALVGGAAGAAMTVGACLWRRRMIVRQSPAVPAVRPAFTSPNLDRWLHRMQRCQQAVHRAEQSVDSVSSGPARLDLRSLVRRMDAELPSVRALVELGRSLDASGRADRAAATRVLRQLDDAVTHFAALAEQIVDAVVDLVAAPDLDRVHRQVVTLRDQFPLQQPMSALLADREPLVGAAG